MQNSAVTSLTGILLVISTPGSSYVTLTKISRLSGISLSGDQKNQNADFFTKNPEKVPFSMFLNFWKRLHLFMMGFSCFKNVYHFSSVLKGLNAKRLKSKRLMFLLCRASLYNEELPNIVPEAKIQYVFNCSYWFLFIQVPLFNS